MGLFDFLVNVEMPMRLDRQSLANAVSEIRQAIELEEARQSEERRRAEEWRRTHPQADSDSDSKRYHTRIATENPLIFGDPHIPSTKCPPNLKAPVLSFSARLLTYVREKCDGRGVIAYKRSGIRRNVYSRIISNDGSMVGKRTALQFCIGLQLSRAEADLLLKAAGYALSETIPEDRIFAYCINNAIWNLEDVNSILSKFGEKPIEIFDR